MRAPHAATTATTLAALALVLAAAAPASAATSDTWAYQPATRQLESTSGALPFSIQGGTTNNTTGVPGIRFTTAPSLATYTGSTFLAPGTADFTYRAVLAVDYVRSKSSANVFQYGLYNTHEIKLQLSSTGVAMCVLNGTGGRVKITSTTPSLDDGGRQHAMACWRRGSTVGVTVDGVPTSKTFALGSVVPSGYATAGNKVGGKAGDQLFGTIWQVGVDVG